MFVGYLMSSGPTPEQAAALQRGEQVSAIGAHSVGVDDGGPGLPLLGWSTEGGDLRIGHFVGLHGMQLIPLLGWLLARPRARRRFSMGQRTALVWIGGLTYIATVVLLTWQAQQGQSVIAPDTTTVTAAILVYTLALLPTIGLIKSPKYRLSVADPIEDTV